MRIVRPVTALAMLVLLGTFAPARVTPPDPPPPQTWLVFEPLAAPDPRSWRGAGIAFLAGWSVTSNDWRFGGLSAFHVEGRAALAFSDAGWRVRFPLPVRAGRARAELGPLPQAPGSADNKADRDIEALAVHGPFAWLALERRNMVLRYERAGWRAAAAAAPPGMAEWRANRGGEAMLRLPDGRFLILSEGSGGISEALMVFGDPAVAGTKAVTMRYRPPAGFRITDAAMLPDGRILFLNRRIHLIGGMSAKLTVGPIPATRPGGLIEGEEIAHLRRPMPVDNMEGLSVAREGGRTILWMVSDDNYNGLQRTLLLKFALR